MRLNPLLVLLASLLLTACPNLESPGRAGCPGCQVPQHLTLNAKGLWTFPNPLSEVPDGAFSRADDAVIRRDGIVETRRGFTPATGSVGGVSDRIRALSDFAGTLVGHTAQGVLARYVGGAWTPYSGTYTPPAGKRMRFLQSAKSLYFTTDAGVKRLDAVGDEPIQSGVPQALGGKTAALGMTGFLPINSQTAYRFVWGYRNENNRIILGPPSGRLTYVNGAMAANSVNIRLTAQIPSWVTPDYFLQVYRADSSATADIPASDDMNLAYEAYPNPTQIAAREIVVDDVTPDELKGQALYASPNQGVVGSEKFEAPVCWDLAEFRERMWCSRTTQRQRVLLTLLSVDATSGGMANQDSISIWDASGALLEVFAANSVEIPGSSIFQRFTAGTPSQNVANTSMSFVRVVNVVSNVIRAFYVSGDYDSPGQILLEAVGLGDAAFTVRMGAVSTANYWLPALSNAIVGAPVVRTAGVVTVDVGSSASLQPNDTVRLIAPSSYSDPTDQANFPPGTYVVSAVPSGTTFQYLDARPDASAVQPIGFFARAEDVISNPTDQPNAISYSEFGEPDAVPLSNYLQVGSANYDVMRIIPLGDSLFVFKEDGTWVVNGDSPETFSVRPFSNPAKLVAPDSAVVLGGRIYGLFDQGVMALTEAGATVVSRPIEGTINAFFSGSAAPLATVKEQAFAVAYETEREYHLFLPSEDGDENATQAYVYNYVTQAWTRWRTPATAGYVLPGQDLEYLGRADSNGALVERKTRTSADYQDAPTVPIVLDVDWQVKTGDNAGAYKQWQKAAILYETPSPTTLTMGFQTEINPTRISGPFPASSLPYILSYVPEEHARSQTLTVGVSGGEVGKRLALTGLSVDYFQSSTKLR